MSQSFLLKEKVIIVTGGTGILGNLLINAIADAGGTVGILGKNRKIAEERSTKINRQGGKAIALCADVTNKNDLNNAKKLVIDTYGKIDGLVNPAGVDMIESVIENENSIFNMNLSNLKRVMELNLIGLILPTEIFGVAMAKHGEGSIVNISTILSKQFVSKPLEYSLSKASVECFTKWFAIELSKKYGDAIRINAIIPEFFLDKRANPLLPDQNQSFSKHEKNLLMQASFKNFEKPDLMEIVVWLSSNASKFINGGTISIGEDFYSDTN